jgi:NADH:ubiquinone reductase (H+-translocating)
VAHRIVIAGGGFGGFYAARALERCLPRQGAHVTLVNEANFMLYTPLLPGAAGATLDPRHVVVPLRSQLRRTDLLIGRVTGADPQAKMLAVRRIDGEQLDVPYDQLLVALGSISRTLPIPGLAEHAIGLKSLSDATALRNRVLTCLDIAESLEDRARRAEYLGFVFVGAGYAGVEGLAELQDFAAQAIELYPRCRADGMRWTLVEAKDRIMQEVPPSLSSFAARELRGRGIEVATDTTLSAVEESSATLSDGRRLAARTVVWTAGVKPSPVIAALGLPLNREGRIEADRTMRVPGCEDVWAIGDCAAVPDPAGRGRAWAMVDRMRRRRSARASASVGARAGTSAAASAGPRATVSCPPTAQHAIRQGRLVARNMAAARRQGNAKPFKYRTKGVVAELGHNTAVAITLGIRWRGIAAWFIARTYHLLLMPGTGRKLRLLMDWNVALLFGRDVSAPGRLGSPTPLDAYPEA